MRRILLALAIFLAYPLAAQNLRITNAVPFGASSLKIVFSNDIDSLSLTPIKLNQNSFYIDIKAVLDIGRKVYFFPRNAQVTIAQNTPEITRIVITNGNGMEYQLKPMQKNLYLSFVDKIPSSTTQSTTQQKTEPKTEPKAQSKPPQAQPTQTSQAKQAQSKPAQKQNATATKTQTKLQNTIPPKKDAPKKDSKQPAKPTSQSTSTSATSTTSNTRKKLKVVIDAGHGGKDCGTLGITKVCEKHIVLKVALKVHNELKKRGYESYLTRDRDIYLSLPERTKLANTKKADLFISIHANSVPVGKKSPKGVETYFLSAARTEDARNVAATENKDDIEIMNYYLKQNFLVTLEHHRIVNSNRLAIDIQREIKTNLKANYNNISDDIDKGVREGPFWVLVGALMPSVLVEIGYNSHPIEAQNLNNDTYQKVLAVGIVKGIDSFVAKNFKE